MDRRPSIRTSVPVSYHINKADEFVSFRFEGKIDLVEIYELARAFLADPDFSASWPHLVDLRGMDVAIQPGAMRPFVKFMAMTYRPNFAAAPLALVIDGDRVPEFSAAVYRFTCGLGHAELFEDYAHAISWLLKNGWKKAGHPAPTTSTLLEPPDSGGDGADEHPKQVRA